MKRIQTYIKLKYGLKISSLFFGRTYSNLKIKGILNKRYPFHSSYHSNVKAKATVALPFE